MDWATDGREVVVGVRRGMGEIGEEKEEQEEERGGGGLN